MTLQLSIHVLESLQALPSNHYELIPASDNHQTDGDVADIRGDCQLEEPTVSESSHTPFNRHPSHPLRCKHTHGAPSRVRSADQPEAVTSTGSVCTVSRRYMAVPHGMPSLSLSPAPPLMDL